jgi:hypothetical protein
MHEPGPDRLEPLARHTQVADDPLRVHVDVLADQRRASTPPTLLGLRAIKPPSKQGQLKITNLIRNSHAQRFRPQAGFPSPEASKGSRDGEIRTFRTSLARAQPKYGMCEFPAKGFIPPLTPTL